MLIQLPTRPPDGHKGTFGHVLVIGGCVSMPGAPALTGLAALRSGAGLVSVATAREAQPITAAYSPALMTIPLSSQAGLISVPNPDYLADVIARADVVVVGPGLGQSESICNLCAHLFLSLSKPLVVDADGLNNLAGSNCNWSRHAGERILTPHPGEFKRIIHAAGNDSLLSNRQLMESRAMEFAKQSNVTVVLKGHRSLVTNGSTQFLNTTGNTALATAGSGDVLAGVIAALLAQGEPALSAAATACHLHGLAGELAARELSEYSVMATDLIDYLPLAFQTLLRTA